MLCITIICLLLPNFQPVLSLVGGVPLTICGIVCPLLIYIKLGQPSRINNSVAISLIIFAVIMMMGNLVVTSRELLKNIIKSEDILVSNSCHMEYERVSRRLQSTYYSSLNYHHYIFQKQPPEMFC